MFHVEHSAPLPRARSSRVFHMEHCSYLLFFGRELVRGAKRMKCSTWNTPNDLGSKAYVYDSFYHSPPSGEHSQALVVHFSRLQWQSYPLRSKQPITSTLECDCGILIGRRHTTAGARSGRAWDWLEPMSRARRAAAARNLMARGRMVSKRSTARRVTTSA